jgi:hypothetical protein
MSIVKAWTDNFLDPDVVANTYVSTEHADYPEANLYDNKRYKKWRSTSDSAQWIKWDLGIPSNPKAFAAISDRNTPLKISPSATITLQGNSTDLWTAPEYEATIPFRDYVLAIENEDGLHTSPLRYWRLYIDDPSNPYGYIELGEVFLGDYVVLTRGCAVYPFQSTLTDDSVVFISEGGQKYAHRRALGQSLSVNWGGLVKGDLEELESIFNYFGFHTPFFMSFDSIGAFSTQKETWVRFVRFNSAPQFTLESFNRFSMSWELGEEL